MRLRSSLTHGWICEVLPLLRSPILAGQSSQPAQLNSRCSHYVAAAAARQIKPRLTIRISEREGEGTRGLGVRCLCNKMQTQRSFPRVT